MRGSKLFSSTVLAGAASLGLYILGQPAFVPPAGQPPVRAAGATMSTSVGAAGAGATAAAFGAMPGAHAMNVDGAAHVFSGLAYPLLKKIDWERPTAILDWFADPGQNRNPVRVAVAFDKLLELGLAMDQKLVREAVQAHSTAIKDAINEPGLVAPMNDVDVIVGTLARALASAPAHKVQLIYDAFSNVGLNGLNDNLMEAAGSKDVRVAYDALIDLGKLVSHGPGNVAR